MNADNDTDKKEATAQNYLQSKGYPPTIDGLDPVAWQNRPPNEIVTRLFELYRHYLITLEASLTKETYK